MTKSGSASLHEALLLALFSLSPQEERAMRIMYGFACETDLEGLRLLKQRAVAETMGVSQSAVSNYVTRARRKMMHPTRSRPVIAAMKRAELTGEVGSRAWYMAQMLFGD